MTKRKKLLFSAAFLMCVATVGVVVHAAYDFAPISDLGDGYVNVISSYSVSAWTTAYERGNDDEDYVSVDFDAYTFGSTVWGPIDANGNDIGPVVNTGRAIEAYAENTDAGAIENVNSYHGIRRGEREVTITIHGTPAG